MARRILTFLFSLLTPGLGYLQIGNRKLFFKTISVFISVIILGVIFRLFTSLLGISSIIIALSAIYLFSAIHATIKHNSITPQINDSLLLKLFFTISFILIIGLSFANRRTIMGFDIMSMSVPVMEPAVLQGEKFLVDTWVYKNNTPKKGDVIAHSFDGQKGLYLNRIIAIENDRIKIKKGVVFLNGHILNEPYVLSIHVRRPQSKDMNELIISKAHYFVMGDNRDASFGDSRFSGTITNDNIVGKITDIISSQDKSRIGNTIK